jgi:hypothetical protein
MERFPNREVEETEQKLTFKQGVEESLTRNQGF